ncbi:MAG: hypothetical protein PHR15_02000 [Atopobiaceae bacterium]|jgi:PHD/YefM family antitoxin component YafN of YafNO toxin-antitoxin module|nr:hypothetical protein [Atopobiaceae bacterium]MCH4179879.1 hypothetical protein [Atopobiaceae bacterium]MCH4213630.1 hypothetical protein [Atopobiaceae bacterium]MCH4230293.1 hypothetical protein [Atopobiaceae bacterium]MCH4276013.1 hypothetical protein [Atopobiaceae bacterium]
MEAIFPVSALSKDSAAVREEARKGLVRITENGHGAYVLCSEEVLDEYVQRKAEQLAFEERVNEGIARGLADVEAGRVYSMEEGESRIKELRAGRAQQACHA